MRRMKQQITEAKRGTSMQTRKRIDWIDMAKGYGMILVILAHLNIGRPLILWIYSFHMPLFFMLSGYVFQGDMNFGIFLKKKCRSLLVPYFGLGIPALLYMLFFETPGGATKENTIRLFLEFLIQNRAWTVWFLACLFWLEIMFYFAVRYLKTERRLLILSVIMPIVVIGYYIIGGKSLPWDIDACFIAFPFFYGGYYYKNHQEKINVYLESTSKWKRIFWGLFLTNFLFGLFSVLLTGKGLEIYWCEYGFPPFVFVSAFAGMGWMIMLSKKKIFRPIRYIGENSLLYYIWHQAIFIPISEKIFRKIPVFQEIQSPGIAIVYIIMQVLFILGVITICNLILNQTKLRILLGKK